MTKEIKKIVFADSELENDLQRLGNSRHREDRHTYRVLQRIRKRVLKRHPAGVEVPKDQIPRVYQHMFEPPDLWRLELPPHGTVLFTRVGDELRIVDIL